MRRSIHLSVVVLLLSAFNVALAQQTTSAGEGREFWLVFQKNFRDYVTDPQTSTQRPAEPLDLQLSISSQQEAHVTVEIPGLGFHNVYIVTPKRAAQITIDNAVQLRLSRNVQKLGIHVVADAPISVFGLNHRFQTTDTYAAIPVHLLGTGYRAIGYGWLERDLVSQLAVVATEDNTIVTIIPTVRTVGQQVLDTVKVPARPLQKNTQPEAHEPDTSGQHSVSISLSPSAKLRKQPKEATKKPQPLPLENSTDSVDIPISINVEPEHQRNRSSALQFTTIRAITPDQRAPEQIRVMLNKGETYQVIAAFDPSTSSDLTGSVISATRPVAVFSGHNCAYVPDRATKACNILVEQLPPMSAWGRTFPVGTLAGRSESVVRVVAMADGTQVRRDSTTVTLNAGEFVDFKRIRTPTLISTSEPALVAQYSCGFGGGDNAGDPMMLLVPPVEQFVRTYNFAAPIRGSWHHYVNVIAPTDAIRDIMIDNNPLGTLQGSGILAIGTGEFSLAQIEVSYGPHTITSSQPFGAYNYGIGYDDASYDAYGHGGGQDYRDLHGEGE